MTMYCKYLIFICAIISFRMPCIYYCNELFPIVRTMPFGHNRLLFHHEIVTTFDIYTYLIWCSVWFGQVRNLHIEAKYLRLPKLMPKYQVHGGSNGHVLTQRSHSCVVILIANICFDRILVFWYLGAKNWSVQNVIRSYDCLFVRSHFLCTLLQFL